MPLSPSSLQAEALQVSKKSNSPQNYGYDETTVPTMAHNLKERLLAHHHNYYPDFLILKPPGQQESLGN